MARCTNCGRILFMVDGKLPAHKVPPVPREMFSGRIPTTPLPAVDAPWCRRSILCGAVSVGVRTGRELIHIEPAR